MEAWKRSSMSRFMLAVICVGLSTGCAAPRTMYNWGSYEELIYTSYSSPGSSPPEQQIERMEQDYQEARSANKRVPPGWHAHLGYLYYQTGKLDQARQELQTEKAEFPESAVFVDRLMTNLNRG